MGKKNIAIVLGALIFFLGFISSIMLLVGMNFSFLTFIDYFGRGIGMIIRLLMICGGLILVYLNASSNGQRIT